MLQIMDYKTNCLVRSVLSRFRYQSMRGNWLRFDKHCPRVSSQCQLLPVLTSRWYRLNDYIRCPSETPFWILYYYQPWFIFCNTVSCNTTAQAYNARCAIRKTRQCYSAAILWWCVADQVIIRHCSLILIQCFIGWSALNDQGMRLWVQKITGTSSLKKKSVFLK